MRYLAITVSWYGSLGVFVANSVERDIMTDPVRYSYKPMGDFFVREVGDSSVDLAIPETHSLFNVGMIHHVLTLNNRNIFSKLEEMYNSKFLKYMWEDTLYQYLPTKELKELLHIK